MINIFRFANPEIKTILYQRLTDITVYEIISFIIDTKLIIKKRNLIQDYIEELKKRHYVLKKEREQPHIEDIFYCRESYGTSCCQIPLCFSLSFVEENEERNKEISLFKLFLLKEQGKLYSIMMAPHYGSCTRNVALLEIAEAALQNLNENEKIPGQDQIAWHLTQRIKSYKMQYLKDVSVMRNGFVGTRSALALLQYMYKKRLSGSIPFNYRKLFGSTTLWKKHVLERCYRVKKKDPDVLYMRQKNIKTSLSATAMKAYNELFEAVFEIDFTN